MPVYRGWIKLHRRLLGSRVFHNEGLLKVFIWCLLKTNHREIWVPFKTGRGDIEVHLKAGEFIFGRNSASEFLKMNPSTVWKRVKKLESMKILNIQSNKQYSVISILNWQRYQVKNYESDSQSNKQGTSKEQASDIDKNDKKIKEWNKIIPPLTGRNKNNISQKLEKFLDKIYNYCEQLTELSVKDNKRFNPYQFVQFQLKNNRYPGAIAETLEGLIKMWADIEDVWAYGMAVIKTINGNWCERDYIAESHKFKQLWISSPKVQNLTSGIGIID